MGKLAGKTVVLTGGTRGLGLEAVRLLANEGATVHFTGRSISHVNRALKELGRPDQIIGHACDVRDSARMTALMATGCDILVNNAAVGGPTGFLHEVAEEKIDECLKINLIAALQVARLAIPGMLQRGGGTIINVSSGAAVRALPKMATYCISKAGLAMATAAIHAEYAGQGIRSFGFQPGIVDTDMQTGLQNSGLSKDILPPADKLLAPEDPAQVIAFLCTPEADVFAGREFSIYDQDLQCAMGVSGKWA